MDTIFMNTIFMDTIFTWKNIKSSYNNNKFKISAPTWSDEFKLPDGSYLIINIVKMLIIHQSEYK